MGKFTCHFRAMLILVCVAGALAARPAFAQTKGNGLPAGQKLLYNLEVIAYDGNNCPAGDFTGSNTHRIAVKANFSDLTSVKGSDPSTLIRQNDILLAAAPATDPNFRVLSGNACLNGTATFQLPTNPCSVDLSIPCSLDTDPTFQTYQVFGRLVGPPKSGVNVTTCATDTVTGLIVCSTESWASVRASKKDNPPKFTNVSKQLLSICVDTTGDSVCDTRLALFAPQLSDFFWNWDTNGKPHAQLFFVAVPD
jgi:hypothetical protein